MINNLLSMTNEEIIKEFRKTINTEIDPEISLKHQHLLDEYKQKIDTDFNKEWSKKRFKWFFKKRRQRKLRYKIMNRYMHPLFYIVEDCIEDMLPNMINESFKNFATIEDMALANPDFFIKENKNED